MHEEKLKGLMGLTVRARQAVFGEEGCLKSIRSGSCGLLLVDSSASAATTKKYRDACTNAGVAMRILPEGMLQEATSRPGMAMAVNRGGLAQQMIQLANNCGGASVE